MDIKPTSSSMYALLVLYDMHTRFFANVIEGISDKDAHNRLNTKANHVAWLTGSLVEGRYELADTLGTHLQQAGHEFFKDHKGIQDGATYPSLTSFKKDWDNISPVLRELLMKVSDEKLSQSFEMMPGEFFTLFELCSFTIHRESYCIGQIGLWRRLMDYPAMKY